MTANSIYQLVNNIHPTVNAFVNVLGFNNPDDHGGGDFFWDSTANEDEDLNNDKKYLFIPKCKNRLFFTCLFLHLCRNKLKNELY